jgi:hypothetical protein
MNACVRIVRKVQFTSGRICCIGPEVLRSGLIALQSCFFLVQQAVFFLDEFVQFRRVLLDRCLLAQYLRPFLLFSLSMFTPKGA